MKNMAASVRQKLLNKARSDKRPFNELLQYYAMERFLYRLSVSSHASRYILKGALMLRVWDTAEIRPTMDIDMLGITSNDAQEVIRQMKDVLSVKCDDGLVFEQESLKAEHITEDADYSGIRVLFIGYLDNAKVNMQIDIGFGDQVYPGFDKLKLPAVLDFPVPELLCYSKETAIAEKFEAMVSLGRINSRMKDFYDIWYLSRQFEFDVTELAEAVRITFKTRGTELPEVIDAFTDGFAQEKQAQWTAFRNRLGQEHLPESFTDVIEDVKTFLMPVVNLKK